jgi:hypothetical protein
LPKEPLPKNELLDIFYNGLTDESKTYLEVVLVVFLGKELRLKLKN